MDLIDLQVELRSIQDSISRLQVEIEKMKPKTDEKEKNNFCSITKLSKKYPIIGLSIANASKILKNEFIIFLSYIFLSEGEEVYSRLLYLCRISQGCKLELSSEEIYKSGFSFKEDDLERVSHDLKEYRDTFLVEAFVMLNLSKEKNYNMISLLADIAKIMGYDEEEIQVLALVAKSRLIDNLEIIKSMKVPSRNIWNGRLKDYIPDEWIKNQRIKCFSIYKNKYTGIFSSIKYWDDISSYGYIYPFNIKEKKANGSIVKKGDAVLIYDKVYENKMEEHILTSPCDGIVYYKEISKEMSECNEIYGIYNEHKKYKEVYIVSYFDDFK